MCNACADYCNYKCIIYNTCYKRITSNESKVIDVSHEKSQMSGACPSLVLLVTTGLALL